MAKYLFEDRAIRDMVMNNHTPHEIMAVNDSYLRTMYCDKIICFRCKTDWPCVPIQLLRQAGYGH